MLVVDKLDVLGPRATGPSNNPFLVPKNVHAVYRVGRKTAWEAGSLCMFVIEEQKLMHIISCLTARSKQISVYAILNERDNSIGVIKLKWKKMPIVSGSQAAGSPSLAVVLPLS